MRFCTWNNRVVLLTVILLAVMWTLWLGQEGISGYWDSAYSKNSGSQLPHEKTPPLDTVDNVGDNTAQQTPVAVSSSSTSMGALPTEILSDSKVVVMGRLTTEDVSWVARELPDWQRAIYTVNSTDEPLHTPINKGKEAMPYLTYLIDNYDTLPLTMAFIHSHEKGYPEAWHNDAPGFSNPYTLQALRLEFVQKSGYVNLRCNPVPGCPDEIQPFRQPPEESEKGDIEKVMSEAWRNLFNKTSEDKVPEVIAQTCCAQFAVSRGQVHKRPKEHYMWFRNWLIETTIPDKTSGRVFEYLWHVIFGKEDVFCPMMYQCYCDVYGRDCDW